jgi:hypothetical protein
MDIAGSLGIKRKAHISSRGRWRLQEGAVYKVTLDSLLVVHTGNPNTKKILRLYPNEVSFASAEEITSITVEYKFEADHTPNLNHIASSFCASG